MKKNKKIPSVGLVIVLAIVATIAALGFYLPIVAAILFVSLTIFLAIARGKAEGFWKGLKLFITEILFGW